MRKIIKKIRLVTHDLKYSLKNLPKSVHLDIPYFCQFMSADLVETYISNHNLLNTDPKWRESGANTISEYEMWTWSDCGIACFKMILSAVNKKYSSLKIVDLAREAKHMEHLNKTKR